MTSAGKVKVATLDDVLDDVIEEVKKNKEAGIPADLIRRILRFSSDPRVLAKDFECVSECGLDDEECLRQCIMRKTEESLKLYGREYGLNI